MSELIISSLVSRLVKALMSGNKSIKLIFLVASILILASIVLVTLVDSKIIDDVYNVVARILGGLGGLCILVIYAYQTNMEESEAKEEIKRVEEKIKKNPNEPTAAWELARIKLENYLNRNLSQIQWIFIWTVITMIIGFIIIAYGILKTYEPTTNLNSNIITIATGLLVEFIGATFLVIYKSTIQQAKEYMNVLERINAVGMSVQILESISKDEIKLQDQTRAEIAKQLLTLYSIKA